jgi:DNA-binding MarR family transcriptional regulator
VKDKTDALKNVFESYSFSYYTKNIMTNSNITKIHTLLEALIRKHSKIEKMQLKFSSSITLFPAEIHTIEIIGQKGRTTVTELCDNQAITKGAVSQIIGKLHKKGFVRKTKRDNNAKEVCLSLTEKGIKALETHKSFHAKIDADINGHLNKFSKAQMESFADLIEGIVERMDKYIQL